VGNIYKGKVARIVPGMDAAFIDVGLEKSAFLYVADVVIDAKRMDPVKKVHELTHNVGADIVIDPKARNVVHEVERLTDGKGVNVVVEAQEYLRP
jgi:ribonuclease G